ncbi:3-hydroxyacyl-CoA dehydrogenase family protein [Haloarchaeobius sp. HRN-SO-5]|uniref:3-hydroxyacyl-CoA dehydrogenase family protein n=1 Tax=Haloarchaeobius sp. HRN-SO-5 TaxID=3446118 RepID=UPI003EBB553B
MSADVPDPEDATIAVVGPGRMGCGIVQTFATAGHDVRLLDTKDRSPEEHEETFETALDTVRSNLAFLAEAGDFEGDADAVVDRVTCTTDAAEALDGADWTFEALPEDPDVKRAFFSGAAEDVPAEGVVATTTSSISLDTVAPAAPDRSRMVITHWLNPAFVVPLVEVARADYTNDVAVEATVELLDSVGKEPVVCADSPGFIGSRVQAAAMNEAVRAWEEGVASAEDIDTALRTGVGFRMAAIGLLEFVDLGGVDVLYYVNEYLQEELGPRFSNPESVTEKMEKNELGPRTGKGYYDYDDVDVDALQAEKYRVMLALREALADAEP